LPFFSIIVPVYKVEKYLDECIQSVLSQSFSDYECILINDGSPDNCPVMCDEYAKNHKQIKVIHKENGGLSDARNTGILQASGKCIVLLDSDDKFADNKTLQNLFDVIQECKTDVVVNVNFFEFTDCGDVNLKNKCNKKIDIATPTDIAVGFRDAGMYLAGCFFVVNREHLIKNDLFFKKDLLHEDEHWMPRVLFTTQQIAVNHSPFYAYRVGRDGSITANVTPKRLFDMLSISQDLLEWAENKELYSEAGRAFMLERAALLYESACYRFNKIKKSDESYQVLNKKLKSFAKVLRIRKKLKAMQNVYEKLKKGFKLCLKFR
jgi:glycosyltransferase involved in cell wall biosynthesis